MSAVLARFLRENRLLGDVEEQRVMAAWQSAAGAGLRERARPVRFRAGELVVEVSSAAHLQELENFRGEGLRRSANRELGAERIRRVRYQPKR